MLSTLGDFLQKRLSGAREREREAEDSHRVRLAAAALLVEVVRADHAIDVAERRALLESLQDRFRLDATEAAELLSAAEQHSQHATDLFQSTSVINRAFSEADKRWLIEELWRAAYADAVLHRHEDHIVRKVADLIYVPHREMLAAKHRVAAERA